MSAFRKAPSLFVSLIVLLFSIQVYGQGTLPPAGERQQYTIYIEMPKAYLSGVGILKNDGTRIVGSLFNEFGLSALDFTYDPVGGKVKLLHAMPMLDKWYIRKTLRKDLRRLFERMSQGIDTYTNERRHILYRFTPMASGPSPETNDL